MSKYFLPASKYFNYFNKQRTQSVQDKITDLENTMSSQGVDVPEKVKRSMLDRLLFGAMGVGNYTVMGSVNEQEKFKNKWKAQGSADFDKTPTALGLLLKAGTSGDFKGTMDSYSKYRKGINEASNRGVVEGLKGANPFGKTYEAGRKTATDVFDTVGWKNDPNDKWYAPANVGRAVAAFGADVAFDPTTYMTFGAGGLARGTGKTLAGKAVEKTIKEGGEVTAKQLAKLSARELAQTNIDSVFKQLGTQGVIDKLAEKGVKIGADEVPDIIAKVQRDSRAFLKPTGMSAFGVEMDGALRRLADRKWAPFINTGIDKLAKSGIGKGASLVTDAIGKKFGGASRLAIGASYSHKL